MLSKKHRFHGHSSLNYTYRRGETVRSPYCAVRYTRGKLDEYRVAVVVSKKVAKAAPKRNRIRRRVYEVMRLLAPTYLTNEDVVITIFDDRFIDLPYEELHASLERQLSHIAQERKQTD